MADIPMTDRGDDEQDQPTQASISGLFARLADDAARLVRAEIDLQRATLLYKVARSRPAIVAIVFAVMLAQGAIACLLVLVAIALSGMLGPMVAGLIVAGGTLAIVALLILFALRRLERLAGDDQ